MHTPGPWQVAKDPDWPNDDLSIITEDEAIAFIKGNDETARDNARLIGAAPRLLSVALLVPQGIEHRNLPNPVTIDISQLGSHFPLRPLSDILREAIAEATRP